MGEDVPSAQETQNDGGYKDQAGITESVPCPVALC